jgi:hypothetical protein
VRYLIKRIDVSASIGDRWHHTALIIFGKEMKEETASINIITKSLNVLFFFFPKRCATNKTATATPKPASENPENN